MFSFFVLILSLFIVHKPSQGGAFGNIMLLLSLWHWNQGPTFLFWLQICFVSLFIELFIMLYIYFFDHAKGFFSFYWTWNFFLVIKFCVSFLFATQTWLMKSCCLQNNICMNGFHQCDDNVRTQGLATNYHWKLTKL